MSEDNPARTLTRPQRDALELLGKADDASPGAWHPPKVMGERSRNAWRLLSFGLVERQEIFDARGKVCSYEYRISESGKNARGK